MLCLTGALYATWHGYGGRDFAATLTTFAFYFAVMLLFAARGSARISRLAIRHRQRLPARHDRHSWIPDLRHRNKQFRVRACRSGCRMGLCSARPGGFRRTQRPGAWQDYLTLVAIWVAVKFSPSHWLWPYPGGRLAYVFTVLLAVNVALATFLLVRRLAGVGYTIALGPRAGGSTSSAASPHSAPSPSP